MSLSQDMELHKIRGGDKEPLENREYNICVGISLGNKWFTPENIVGQIEWSLRYSKKFVVVCPADDIHTINIQVRSRKSKTKAQEHARKMSELLMAAVRAEADCKFTEEEKQKIIYATWSDVADEKYMEKVNYLYGLYQTNPEFKLALQKIVKDGVSKEERVFSEEDVDLLATYLIEELPELISRVPFKGYVCDAYTYSFDVPLAEFVERIQKGEIFQEISQNIMDTEPKVFLEVR